MRTIGLLALCLLLPACAAAAPAPLLEDKEWYPHSPTGVKEYGREGGYVGMSGIMSFEQFDLNLAGVSADDSSAGLGIRGGWRSKEGVAVEVVLENSMDYEISSATASADLDIWSVGVQGKYYLGHEMAQPYVLLGVGWAQVDMESSSVFDDEGTYVRLGIGAEVYITPDVAVFGEANYNRMMGGVKDFDHADLQAGFLFRF